MRIRLVMNYRDLIGSSLPKWYGIAYRHFDTKQTVLCIIPLNLVLRSASGIYWFFYQWVRHGHWETKLDDAYWRGFNDGNARKEEHYKKLAQIIIDSLRLRR